MASGIISGTTSNGYIDCKIEWSSKATTSSNSSVVTAKLYYKRNNTGYTTSGTGTFTIDIGGKKTSKTHSISITENGWTLAVEGTATISHDSDGKKSITISASGSISVASLSSTTCSGKAVLDTIPRYATSIQTLNSKTETTITMNWSSDSTVDYIWYSKDGGSTWVAVGSVSATSGSYRISGLSANTSYSIKTRVRRKDSQLTTDSSALSVTTYNYPYCTSMPNFTLGNAVTLGFYNPLGRSFNFYIIGNGTQINATYSCSSTSYSGVNSSETSVPYLYKTIPNTKSATYQVKVVYGSSTITKTGGTYSVNTSACTPTFTESQIFYADTSSVKDITGNPQHIVQDQSNLKVTIGSATAKNEARISKYDITVGGVTKSVTASGTVDFGKLNTSNNIDISVTVTDSRGITATAKKTVTVLAWSSPIVTANVSRLNNYEAETYLTVDASVSSVNGKNTMAISYVIETSDGNYSTVRNISNKTKYTLNLDKEESFKFHVTVTDVFTSVTRVFPLSKGVFPLFIDTQKNAVGVNDFPAEGEALKVSGGVAHFQDGVKIGGSLIDYVMEFGTFDIWTYELWASGKSVCWGTLTSAHEHANGTSSLESGSVAYSLRNCPFPQSNTIPSIFKSKPLIFLTATDIGGGVCSTSDETTNNAGVVASIWGKQTALGDINVYAIGRWK